MATPLPLRKFTVDQYYRMAEAGILTEDDRVELIDGGVVEMPPIGPRHAAYTDRVSNLFFSLVQGRAIVRVQSPLALSDLSEPVPDVLLLQPRADFYVSAHPFSEDVLLLIEVSDTSSRYDREVKLPLYATAGVAEVWVVDVDRLVLEVYTRPAAGHYQHRHEVTEGVAVAPSALPGTTVSYAQLFGR